MIAIDNVLISNQVVEEQFVCDLNKCKGGCCVDGDAGAPLDKSELKELNKIYDAVLPYLTEESKRELERQGKYVYDKEFGWVTPTIQSKICVYGIVDKNGIVKCGIEQAYLDGKISWKKPISCHLYPIRITAYPEFDVLNYDRWNICSPACSFGDELKVRVHEFLKDPLIRKYGKEWYQELENEVSGI